MDQPADPQIFFHIRVIMGMPPPRRIGVFIGCSSRSALPIRSPGSIAPSIFSTEHRKKCGRSPAHGGKAFRCAFNLQNK